jgi:hypothetical protein
MRKCHLHATQLLSKSFLILSSVRLRPTNDGLTLLLFPPRKFTNSFPMISNHKLMFLVLQSQEREADGRPVGDHGHIIVAVHDIRHKKKFDGNLPVACQCRNQNCSPSSPLLEMASPR